MGTIGGPVAEIDPWSDLVRRVVEMNAEVYRVTGDPIERVSITVSDEMFVYAYASLKARTVIATWSVGVSPIPTVFQILMDGLLIEIRRGCI
jgi:hypothetical protein